MAYIAKTSFALLAALLLIPQLFGSFAAYQIGLFLIYGIAAQGIGYLWGRAGVLPFGQAAFFGVAAYACAHVLRSVDGLALQLICIVCIVLFAALIAFVLSSAIFRGRSDSGPYFSLITLALAMLAEQVAGTATTITGGFNGLSGFSAIGGLDQFGSFYYVIVACVVASTAALLFLDKLPAGLVARAVADNEKRMQLLGFPTHVVKGLAFGLSAALAAIAGVLFANHQGIVTPTSTGFVLSANLVIWTAVGGRYHVLGPLIGSIAIGYFAAEFRDTFAYWEVCLALIFIMVVLKAPGGFTEAVAKLMPKRSLPSASLNLLSEKAPGPIASSAPSSVSFHETRVQMGPVKILNGVNLKTPSAGTVCIIGPNGAGKTSLLNAITGNLPVRTGSIEFDKTSIENRAPYRALASGISRKLQVPSVFSSMSVQENICVSMLAGRAKFADFFKSRALNWRSNSINRLLENTDLPLKSELSSQVSSLPQGHRQFLEFAMTVASESRLLLLDEPCAGLSPAETAQMTEIVKEFQDENMGLILLIEHDMSIVRELADHVVVMHQGKVLAEGTYEEIKANQSVKAVYAGGAK